MRTIIGAWCTLEPQVAAHAREIFQVLNDPEIYESESQPPVTEEWLTRRYKRQESRGNDAGLIADAYRFLKEPL